jgi:hypothetical protein
MEHIKQATYFATFQLDYLKISTVPLMSGNTHCVLLAISYWVDTAHYHIYLFPFSSLSELENNVGNNCY